jgi:hypothetical protein
MYLHLLVPDRGGVRRQYAWHQVQMHQDPARGLNYAAQAFDLFDRDPLQPRVCLEA